MIDVEKLVHAGEPENLREVLDLDIAMTQLCKMQLHLLWYRSVIDFSCQVQYGS